MLGFSSFYLLSVRSEVALFLFQELGDGLTKNYPYPYVIVSRES